MLGGATACIWYKGSFAGTGWMPSVFYPLPRWDPFSVDLFTARNNTQPPHYSCFSPDPGALAVDAFSQRQNMEIPYAFPPFTLVGCLQRDQQR